MMNFVTGKKQSPESHCSLTHCGVHLAAGWTDAQLVCQSVVDTGCMFVYVVTYTGVLGRFFVVPVVVVIHCILTFHMFVYNSILVIFEELNLYYSTN
jgi:hypothetical protein